MEFKSQFYGLSKKIKNAGNIAFIFNDLANLTMKIDSTLSSINMCYYLKLRISIIDRDLFEIISQKPEYVRTHCNG